MTTEQYPMGKLFTRGYQAGWNAAMDAKPAQQEPVTIGEPVGWHSKQYGFVYMALQPHQFEVGSTLCLKNGTPAWRIESSCSMTALISMSSLPHGTVFYTSPPAQRKPLTDWIDPNDKTQKQYLPHIGEPVLFCNNGVTYMGKHTGGSFQSEVTNQYFNTWECRWMYLPAAHGIKENT